MKSLQFIASVQTRVGNPYWYACYGQVATPALLDYKSKQYPKMWTLDRIAKAKTEMGKRVWDCVGLIKGTVWDADFGGKYQSASDLSADGMYNAGTLKGAIGTMPEVPGYLVHKAGHIGVYIGNGKVVEAKGFSDGVIITNLKDRPWSDWCKCHIVDYSDQILVVTEALVKQLKAEVETQKALVASATAEKATLQTRLDVSEPKAAKVEGLERAIIEAEHVVRLFRAGQTAIDEYELVT